MNDYDLPWIHRPVTGSLRLKMPYDRVNRLWLRDVTNTARHRHVGSGVWEVGRGHLRALIGALLARHSHLDVLLDFNAADRCDTRCQGARGDECVCSCAGRYHGGGILDDWTPVGDTTLVASTHIRRHIRLVAEPKCGGGRPTAKVNGRRNFTTIDTNALGPDSVAETTWSANV